MAFLIPENLKSRRDVPAAIRTVARAFQIGLDEDVTVWYEPPYDPTGRRPPLVVLLPDRGVAVLEVMILQDGREIPVGSPLERAETLAGVLRARIAEEPRLQGEEIRVGAGAVLPHLRRDEAEKKKLSSVLPPKRCLFKEDVDRALEGTGEDALLQGFTRIVGPPRNDEICGEPEKALRALIHPDTVIKPTQLTLFRPAEGDGEILRVMDRRQEAMAKTLGEGHRILRGVAGSGKTLVLVYRARLMASLYPREPFLVTCYNRSLAGQLRELLGDYPNVEVANLDRVMADAIRQARLPHPGYRGDDSGDRVASVALTALTLGAGKRYRAVFLDEAQDFGTDALRFVVGLLDPHHPDLLIVADAAQNIFRRRFRWKDAGIQAQGRTRILRVNYRNTREILEFASRFLPPTTAGNGDPEDENAILPAESACRSGPPPEVMLVEDLEEEVEQAVEQTLRWLPPKPAPRQLALLYPSHRDPSGEDRARLLMKELRRQEIPTFWLTDPENRRARDELGRAREPVVLSTIHSAKGLEFDSVVLCGAKKEGVGGEDLRKLLYVGMTRAMNRLCVVVQASSPLAEDLRRASR